MCDGQIVKKNIWKILVGIGESIIFVDYEKDMYKMWCGEGVI